MCAGSCADGGWRTGHAALGVFLCPGEIIPVVCQTNLPTASTRNFSSDARDVNRNNGEKFIKRKPVIPDVYFQLAA